MHSSAHTTRILLALATLSWTKVMMAPPHEPVLLEGGGGTPRRQDAGRTCSRLESWRARAADQALSGVLQSRFVVHRGRLDPLGDGSFCDVSRETVIIHGTMVAYFAYRSDTPCALVRWNGGHQPAGNLNGRSFRCPQGERARLTKREPTGRGHTRER